MLWLVHRGLDGEMVGHAILKDARNADGDPLLYVVSVGGRGGKHWVPLLHSFLNEQVRAGHYVGLAATCRPGMKRWLERLGWKVRQYAMEYQNDGRDIRRR